MISGSFQPILWGNDYFNGMAGYGKAKISKLTISTKHTQIFSACKNVVRKTAYVEESIKVKFD